MDDEPLEPEVLNALESWSIVGAHRIMFGRACEKAGKSLAAFSAAVYGVRDMFDPIWDCPDE